MSSSGRQNSIDIDECNPGAERLQTELFQPPFTPDDILVIPLNLWRYDYRTKGVYRISTLQSKCYIIRGSLRQLSLELLACNVPQSNAGTIPVRHQDHQLKIPISVKSALTPYQKGSIEIIIVL